MTELAECDFYHTMDVPGYGHVTGTWDFRKSAAEYLGHVDLQHKRVLEVGPASGFFTFYMESEGAEVVAYDLSEEQSWDIVPYAAYDFQEVMARRKGHIRRLNNSWWLCHRAHDSKAKIVYGSVYDVPMEIGAVDVVTFAAVLLHLRDPFLALQKALRLVRETVVIVEPVFFGTRLGRRLLRRSSAFRAFVTRASFPLYPPSKARMDFVPRHWEQSPFETWWYLYPNTIARFLGVLGFEQANVSYHAQRWEVSEEPVPFFTVVGRRQRQVL